MILFLRHLFIPHHTNNHRPKLLHHKSLFILILLIIIASSWVYTLRQTIPSVLGVATNITAQDLLSFTNQKRQEEGLPPLVLNSELSQAASGKASDMFTKDYWAHNAPDGTTPWVFIQNSGYNYVFAGENLAKDFGNSEGVVSAWMASPSHRENMLSAKYDEVGFAVVNGNLNGEETTLVVELLGRRPGGEPVAAAASTALPTAIPTIAPQTPVVVETPIPTPIPSEPTAVPTPQSTFIAGVSNKPLIDSQNFTKRLSISILALIILAFILDMIYIERKKLVRLVGHNLDHVLFLAGAIGLIIMFGKGVIL